MNDKDELIVQLDRDSIDGYYRPPEHLGATTAKIDGPGGGKSRHFALGLILLLAAVPCQFMAFCVGLFLLDPSSTIDDDDYLNNDPSTVPDGGTEMVVSASAPVRNTQALFSLSFSAISLFAVIAAVGLMRGKRRGRLFALIWSGLAVFFVATELIVHFTHVFPMYDYLVTRLGADCGPGCVELLDAVCGLSTATGPVGLVMFDVPLLVLPIVMMAATNSRELKEGCVR